MAWGIKDEYFEKVYGKSYKPKSGTSERRVRPKEAEQPAPELPRTTIVSGGENVRDQLGDVEELSGQLRFEIK